METAERFWAKVDKTGECWEWTGCLGSKGYGNFWCKKLCLAHRYSYIIHHPLTINLLERREICVCHRCDNPKCVNPAHLFLGTMKDNTEDMVAKGRHHIIKGEKNPFSKLTETQVREIRNKYANCGINQRQLALEYGVSIDNISSIIRRKTWSHLLP